ncbi:MAG TPA: formimidoylglutamase [Flavobacteriaceae bacterium]|nr:formimidoylglutamase [Flavobacteriaceae bacterium]
MDTFFSPVSKTVLAHRELLGDNVLGKKITVHANEGNFPDIEDCKIVIIGVCESRNSENHLGKQPSFDFIRKSLYSLYAGNWSYNIADLGDIKAGENVEDTYFAVKKTVESLVSMNKIPVILGGSQDLTYAVYRAYDNFSKMVNVVNIDNRFDIGNSENPITSTSFVGKMVVEMPFNLHNYTNLGYQTYFNSPEEIDLLERLYFDALRLGELTSNITLAEPVLREADIVTFDITAIKSSEMSYTESISPNGLDGREACTLARYSGISNQVSSFGIYELENFDKESAATMLVAQMLWYFIEGVNFRIEDGNPLSEKDFTTYKVPVEDEVLVFKRSNKSQRWWVEIPFDIAANNKNKTYTLLPCTYDDYQSACNQEIPERWIKARQKNES